MSSYKVCSYRDCTNSTRNIRSGSDVTFFKFPLIPERLASWKIACGLSEDSNPKYICSNHFDAKKYISCNSRRKILTQTAVPYNYEPETRILQTNSNIVVRKYNVCNSRRIVPQTAVPYDCELESTEILENFEEVKLQTNLNLIPEQMFDDSNEEYELLELVNENSQILDKNDECETIGDETLDPNPDMVEHIENDNGFHVGNLVELTPIKVIKSKKKRAAYMLQALKRTAESMKGDFIEDYTAEYSKKTKLSETLGPKENSALNPYEINDYRSPQDITNNAIANITRQKDVNVFTLKNEEYIQMPKKMLTDQFNVLAEQIQSSKILLNEIQYYKNKLIAIRNLTDNIQ